MKSLAATLHHDNWKAIEVSFAAIESQIFEEDERRALADRDSWPVIDFFRNQDIEDDPQHDLNEFEATIALAKNALRARLRERFEQVFWELSWLCTNLEIPTDSDAWETIQNALAALSVRQPFVIYEAPAPKIYVPALLVTTNFTLIEIIKRDPALIFGISPREFEELIAGIFNEQGFDVELTKQTRDGGRDIVAINKIMGVAEKWIIECKRYAPANKVSVEVVQRLYGVKMAEAANKAILATTSDFTRPARDFAKQHVWDLDLKAHHDIMEWIRGIRPPNSR